MGSEVRSNSAGLQASTFFSRNLAIVMRAMNPRIKYPIFLRAKNTSVSQATNRIVE
jgi:hypothetical protein